MASARTDDRCPLCGRRLAGEPSVALRGGGAAHRSCAERQATTAWRRRRRLALGHALLVLLALGGAAAWGWPAPALAATEPSVRESLRFTIRRCIDPRIP